MDFIRSIINVSDEFEDAILGVIFAILTVGTCGIFWFVYACFKSIIKDAVRSAIRTELKNSNGIFLENITVKNVKFENEEKKECVEEEVDGFNKNPKGYKII